MENFVRAPNAGEACTVCDGSTNLIADTLEIRILVKEANIHLTREKPGAPDHADQSWETNHPHHHHSGISVVSGATTDERQNPHTRTSTIIASGAPCVSFRIELWVVGF